MFVQLVPVSGAAAAQSAAPPPVFSGQQAEVEPVQALPLASPPVYDDGLPDFSEEDELEVQVVPVTAEALEASAAGPEPVQAPAQVVAGTARVGLGAEDVAFGSERLQ